ncbi:MULTISPECIES: serine hydrolase [Clostridium]|uniref:Serine hydrolase n=1 Tax=Clostridium aquiflavi TaxID=3073603 RepID=A0ABU1EKC1_9CLOT|nr:MULTISPECIES: serine hydrolase [unclassified Clostridium]MDR5588841.1 serine hydrolase [Clostridium sp. 5N-1]NFG62957.1 serine hydrolase [Clostridium botulinum]NFQ08647.1 serine hydrolase [Clostridium botulinum]
MRILKDYFVTFLILTVLIITLFFCVYYFPQQSEDIVQAKNIESNEDNENYDKVHIDSDNSHSSNTENIENVKTVEPTKLITGTKINKDLFNETLSDNEKLKILNDSKYNLEDRILFYLGSDSDRVGFIYYDLNYNKYIELNKSNTFIAASTYKVKLNVLTYEKNKTDKNLLNKKLDYKEDDYEEGTGILQNLCDIPPTPISELLDLSIINSDNIATNMIGSYLGGHDQVRKEINEMFNISIPYNENITTPETEFRILKHIYDNKSDVTYSHLIDVLKSTDYHDRIDKYIPHNIVAHKVGSSNEYIHDIAIVFPDNPYIFIIYTKDLENAEEKIAQISKTIYNYQVNNRIIN